MDRHFFFASIGVIRGPHFSGSLIRDIRVING
jgi:hypothetical protein